MNLLTYNLLGKKPNGFGLEIEDSSLKAIMLKKEGERVKVVSCGARSLKKGIIQEGQVLDKPGLAKEINELITSTKPKPIKSKFVVFSVPEAKSFIRTIQIPKMTKAEATEAVKWETEANIPVSAENVYLDWQAIEQKEKNEEVLVVAVPKEIIKGYYESITLAKLFPLAAEVDAIAPVRSLTSDQEKTPVLVADVGADITSLIISKNQVPYFTSSIPLGGKTFTKALQNGLGISWEKAEEMKTKYGLGKTNEDKTFGSVYNPLLENLVQEVEKSLAFYTESINPNEEVNKIILSGGGALLRDMVSFLSQRIKKEVVLGNPAVGLGVFADLAPDVMRDICPYATTVGLAIRAMNYDD